MLELEGLSEGVAPRVNTHERQAKGSVALPLCTTTHSLYTRFANIFGASTFEPTMRPNPRQVRVQVERGREMQAELSELLGAPRDNSDCHFRKNSY